MSIIGEREEDNENFNNNSIFTIEPNLNNYGRNIDTSPNHRNTRYDTRTDINNEEFTDYMNTDHLDALRH